MWENGKMLVIHIFSFPNIVFKSFPAKDSDSFTQQILLISWDFPLVTNIFSCSGNVLTLYHTIPTFNDPDKRSLLKTLWEKEKMLVTSIFSFSHNDFYPSKKECLFLKYIYFVVCKCVEFLTVLKLVVWYRVKKPFFSRLFKIG